MLLQPTFISHKGDSISGGQNFLMGHRRIFSLTLLGALCFAELGTLVPKSGGNYTYVLMAFGDLAGFMVVWAFAVIIKPCGIALSTLTLSTYVIDYIIPGDCAPPMAAVQLFAIVTIST